MFDFPNPPIRFTRSAHGNCWFRWCEVFACFWPGRGGRSHVVEPLLAEARFVVGIYLMAWSQNAPAQLPPAVTEVVDVGETGGFRHRMGQFGNSAGFWGER